MNPTKTCSVTDLHTRLRDGGDIVLVDVREPAESAGARIDGARLIPLGTLRQNPALAGESGAVYLLCRSGHRAEMAAQILRQQSGAKPIVVAGGMLAWTKAGYPVSRTRGPIALERQVRIAAGTLVLIGLLVPGMHFLPYIVGVGLIFAGVTDTCAMGLLLMRLPWNRSRTGSAQRQAEP